MMDPRAQALEAEIRELQRKADMLPTMHACLRDRYSGYARITHAVLTLSALGVCVLTLARQDVLSLLVARNADIWIGLAGAVAFGAAIVSDRADWSGKRARHEQGVRACAAFKQKCRRVLACKHTRAELQALALEWEFIGDKCIPIPESQFTRLKAAHLHKVAVSKAISESPGAPAWLVSARLRLGSTLRVLRPATREETDGQQNATVALDGRSPDGNNGPGTVE